jgi:hypothetical protein
MEIDSANHQASQEGKGVLSVEGQGGHPTDSPPLT